MTFSCPYIRPSTITRDDSGPDLLRHTVCLWWQWTLASYELLYNTMCSSGDVTFLMPLGTPQCLPLLWRLSSCLGKWVKFSPYSRVLTYHHNMFQPPSYLLPAVSVHTTISAKVNEPSPNSVTDPNAIGSCSWAKGDVLSPTQTCNWPDLFVLQECSFRYGFSILSYLSVHHWLNPKLLKHSAQDEGAAKIRCWVKRENIHLLLHIGISTPLK